MADMSKINFNIDGVNNEFDIKDKKAREEIAINRATLGTQSKNLATSILKSQTTSGITVTVNDDKSITFNGTATKSLFFTIGYFTPPDIRRYALSGCPDGGSNKTYQLYISDANAYNAGPLTYDTRFTPTNTDRLTVSIVIYKDAVCDNLTFYPMVRDANITDRTYEPYKPSLQEQINTNKNDILSAQNQIDTQTLITTSGEVNSKNWYRAFKVSQKGAVRTGIISINRGYSNGLPEQYILSINIGYYANKINLISRFIEKDSNNVGRPYIDKIRIVHATSSPSKNNCYIDIYYNADLINIIYASILANATNSEAFSPANFSVAEIPEGYTSTEFDLTEGDILDRLKNLKDLLCALHGAVSYSVTANGSFTAAGVTENITNRIRTDIIPVKAGDVIEIVNGSFVHGCGIWKGEVNSVNIIRNDSKAKNTNENVIIEYDGNIVITFLRSNDENISLSDFDGSVTLYRKST